MCTYDREQFTLPVWSNHANATVQTRISVPVVDKSRLLLLRKNLEAWATSPASMLFFRNLQSLTVESHTICKEVVAARSDYRVAEDTADRSGR